MTIHATLTKAESKVAPIEMGFFEYTTLLHGAPDRAKTTLSHARAAWKDYRTFWGYVGDAPLMTAPESQTKLGKSATPSYGLMLTPERGIAEWGFGGLNLCPWASKGCAAECLNTSGKGRLAPVQKARACRTAFLLEYPYQFGVILAAEMMRAIRKHGDIRIRLNVVSDIRWEFTTPQIFATVARYELPVTFYDYTAYSPARRAPKAVKGYSLTYSRKETHSDSYVRQVLADGGNVAIVFAVKRGQALPDSYLGFRVIDGDKSDDRTQDPKGVIVGLRAKGDAIGDETGFVVPVAPCGCGCGTPVAGTPGDYADACFVEMGKGF